MSYFPEPFDYIFNIIRVELNLANFATKSDLIKATVFDTCKLVKKTDLASLKSDVNDLDIDKLKTVPVALRKLRNGVKTEVVKKTEYDKLVTKVNAIDISRFVL